MMNLPIFVVFLCVLASSTFACTERRVRGIERVLFGGIPTIGENCARTYRPGVGKDWVDMLEAKDLGQKVVLQSIAVGACGGSRIETITDCRDGAVLILESSDSGYVFSESEDGIIHTSEVSLLLQRANRDAVAFTPAAIHKLAANYPRISKNKIVASNDRIMVEGRELSLSCGCEVYYPESVGALQ